MREQHPSFHGYDFKLDLGKIDQTIIEDRGQIWSRRDFEEKMGEELGMNMEA